MNANDGNKEVKTNNNLQTLNTAAYMAVVAYRIGDAVAYLEAFNGRTVEGEQHSEIMLTPDETRVVEAFTSGDAVAYFRIFANKHSKPLTAANEKTALRKKIAKQFASIVFGALVKERFVQLDSLFLSNEAPAMFDEITASIEDGLAFADSVEMLRLYE